MIKTLFNLLMHLYPRSQEGKVNIIFRMIKSAPTWEQTIFHILRMSKFATCSKADGDHQGWQYGTVRWYGTLFL